MPGSLQHAALRSTCTLATPLDGSSSDGGVQHHRRPLHHIGIGRAYAETRVLLLLLVQDLDTRVINAATGELIRELVLNPETDYQPTGKPSGWPEKTPRPLRGLR